MITYSVNGTTVTAKFTKKGTLTKNIWRKSLFDLYYKYTENTAYEDYGYSNYIVNKLLDDRKLVGVAKCHPNDEFNIEEGKRLAREDLLNRFEKAKIQLKKEILYMVKHEVKILQERM